MAPTLSLWDCGEFIACSVTLGVPHPPGTPLFLLLGNVFSHIPIFSDIGARVNFISPIVSALSVMFLYLIVLQLIKKIIVNNTNANLNNDNDVSDAINKKIEIAQYSAFIAALTFAVTDSHWFNAVESEVYSLSTFFTSIVVWLILKWDTKPYANNSIKYIILISYMMGLAIGIHLLNLLAIPCIIFIIYYTNDISTKLNEISYYKISLDILKVSIYSLIIFGTIYYLIILKIPWMASKIDSPHFLLIFIYFGCLFLCYYFITNKEIQFSIISVCLLVVLIGFSTYSTIFIRASQHPSINENNPDTAESFLYYMNREQYGNWKKLDPKSTIQRQENTNWRRYTENRSDPSNADLAGFVWNYQIKEMYLRYFAWQFIGRGDYNWDLNKKDGTYIKSLEGVNPTRYIIPLAFIFGIIGFIYHAREDHLRALSILSLFLATGLLIILYLNQYDPQPRERDYSYVGSFFAFSIWIGIGIYASIYKVYSLIANKSSINIVPLISLIVLLSIPVNMFANDYREHNRSGNYVAWDYAYNLLNSCAPNSILFTNGDNDTFPLWYIQEVENLRKDVRVVNLSLLNTPWYIKQLKNEYNTLPINFLNLDKISSDKFIDKLEPVSATAFALQEWTNEWERLNAGLNNYFRQKMNQSYSLLSHGIPVDWGEVDASILYADEFEINFKLKSTFSNYLKVQDVMVLKLINDMPKTRPIYFAVTVSPGHRLGLENYLEMEGLVYKFVPHKMDNNGHPKMNINNTLRNITQSDDMSNIIRTANEYQSSIDSNQGIYRYRNLNNPDVYFNGTIQRLAQNYRSSFIQIAFELISNPENYPKINEVFMLMDRYLPIETIKITHPEIQIQIANVFNQIGNKDMFKKYITHCGDRSDIDIQQSYMIGQMMLENLQDPKSAIIHFKKVYLEYPNIFEIVQSLSLAYLKAGDRENGIKIVEEWNVRFPNDSKSQEWLKLIKDQ